MRDKNRYISIVAFAAVLILILTNSLSILVSAYTNPTPPSVSNVDAYCLYDKTHQKMIVSENIDKQVNTSTSAKIISGLIACENLENRRDDVILITSEMLEGVSGYNMKLTEGEKISIDDLLYAAICGSYNDAYYVLAYICAGSINDFVSLMNLKAYDLGAAYTTYTNPIGYPDNAAMITTASDTLKIALAASDNALFMEICSATSHRIKATNKSEERTVYNRNALISSSSGTNYHNSKCRGMNAGYSGEAGGWSVITLAQDDGADYICIVLGGKENEDGSQVYAYKAVNTLVNWACGTYNLYNVFPAGKQMGTTKIKLSGVTGNDAPYITADALDVYIPTDATYDIELSYNILLDSKSFTAPIDAGSKVGVVRVHCNGEVVGECELILKDGYETNGIMLAIDTLGEYTKSRAFISTVVCFVILLVAFIIYSKSHSSMHSKRKHYVRK